MLLQQASTSGLHRLHALTPHLSRQRHVHSKHHITNKNAGLAGPLPSRRMRMHVMDKFRDLLNSLSDKSSQSSSQSDLDSDTEEGSEMVRIDTESRGGLGGTTEDVFGPLAVLLVGFLADEYEAFRAMMVDIEADMVKVVPCTKVLMGGTLQQALQSEYPAYEQPPLGQRRVLFLSGMYGSEVTELIAAYREAGLPPCAFAAAVPNNYNRNVKELAEAVWRDQAAMMAKQQRLDVEDSY